MELIIKDLVDQNFENRNQFAKAMQIQYPDACKLYSGNSKQIRLATLEKLCDVLHCTPNDILK